MTTGVGPRAVKVGYPKTPELNKMLRVKYQSQRLGEFLEWYRNDEHGFETVEETLARYFKIDLRKVEEERRAVLEYVRRKAA